MSTTSVKKLLTSESKKVFDEAFKNRENLYNELEKSWTERVKCSNEMIDCISKDSNYVQNNKEKIEEEIEKLNNSLDSYAELGINMDEFGFIKHGLNDIRRTLEKNYRTLSLKYFSTMINKTEKNSRSAANKQKDLIKNLNNTNNKIESLGATFLNIVLTISIVSSMVAVLVKVPVEYTLPVGLLCAWLLLSSLLFIGEYFKNSIFSKHNEFSKKVYIILSIVTFSSLIIPIAYPIINKSICDNLTQKVYILNNNGNVRYTIIDDKVTITSFLNSFSNYWESSDKNYYRYLGYLNTDNISNIVFYRYFEDHTNIYSYEIFLKNGTMITLDIQSEDLEKWFENNDINIW